MARNTTMPSSYAKFCVFQYRSTMLNKTRRFAVQAAKSSTDSTAFLVRFHRLIQGSEASSDQRETNGKHGPLTLLSSGSRSFGDEVDLCRRACLQRSRQTVRPTLASLNLPPVGIRTWPPVVAVRRLSPPRWSEPGEHGRHPGTGPMDAHSRDQIGNGGKMPLCYARYETSPKIRTSPSSALRQLPHAVARPCGFVAVLRPLSSPFSVALRGHWPG